MATAVLGTQTVNHSGEIAFRNDVFRRKGQNFTLTDEAIELPNVCGLIRAIQEYHDFGPDNDPYGEHDFGTVYWEGEKVLG